MEKNNEKQTVLQESSFNEMAVAVLDKEELGITTKEYSDDDIIGMIYMIRGQKVMLDSDLAKLYGYEIKRLNEQVKRNMDRFPGDFMFQLTIEEAKSLPRSQFATMGGKGKNIKYAPYVFTEEGANQLSAVLRGPVAAKQSVHIMRVFVKLKHREAENRQLLGSDNILKIAHSLIKDNIKIKEDINSNYKEYKENINAVKNEIDSIKENMATKDDIQSILDNFIVDEKIKEFAFLKGDKFEADELFIKLYKDAKHSIYIIDNYVSIKTLSHLKHKRDFVNVVIFTNNSGGRDKLRKAEFDDFNTQYPPLILKPNYLSHDRYIILDYNTDLEKIYHSGASIKDVGKKACSVNEISDISIYHSMIDELLLQGEIELF